jgi:NADH-quinone oxidoreductase subunit L
MTAAHGHEIVIHTSTLLRWIPLLPLIGAAINFLVGARIQKKFGRGGVAGLATLMPAMSFVLVVMSFLQLQGYPTDERLIIDNVLKWIHIGTLNADIAFQFDPLSAVMCLVVTGVGSLIHVYSYGYMDDEPAAWRFFALLNLFMFAMLCLVLGDNLLIMFLGWEGVGLCSWGLIGFWFSEMANARAGNKAFIVNRVGDFGFTLGVFLLFWTLDSHGAGTVVFRELAGSVHLIADDMLWGTTVATVVTLFLFVGAAGKSAQIPLYVWLPDAMAGPTPVSALIHAATMVTAGIYMIARMNFIFDMAPVTGQVITTIGALTAFFAATIGLAQNDIKKVLAYSTVSQLGYMFIAVGVGAYAAGVFHLMTHAFFKACLFLGAGSVIHAMHHEQDMRNMGGLRKYMPRTFWTFLIATIAIAGFPPLAGFFSKDEILWKAFNYSPAIWAIGFAAAAMTSFYMFRLVFMTFSGECRADHHTVEHLHESSGWMTWPLVILAGGSIFAGFLGVPAALGGSNIFEHWLEPVMAHSAHGAGHDAHAHHNLTLEYGLMVASVAVAFGGLLLAHLMYNKKSIKPDGFTQLAGGRLHTLIYNKYYIDEIYQVVWVNGTLGLAKILAWFDANVVDGMVNGTASVTKLVSFINGRIDHHLVDGLVNKTAGVVHGVGGAVRRIQTGSINAYLYVIVIVVTAVLFARTW